MFAFQSRTWLLICGAYNDTKVGSPWNVRGRFYDLEKSPASAPRNELSPDLYGEDDSPTPAGEEIIRDLLCRVAGQGLRRELPVEKKEIDR